MVNRLQFSVSCSLSERILGDGNELEEVITHVSKLVGAITGGG
jgi:hypothetical protein